MILNIMVLMTAIIFLFLFFPSCALVACA